MTLCWHKKGTKAYNVKNNILENFEQAKKG